MLVIYFSQNFKNSSINQFGADDVEVYNSIKRMIHMNQSILIITNHNNMSNNFIINNFKRYIYILYYLFFALTFCDTKFKTDVIDGLFL